MSVVEKTIENCCNAYAKKRYAKRVLIRKMNGLGFRHWPDRAYFFDCSNLFFIEYKRPGERPEPAQGLMHKMLTMLGYKIYVVDNVNDGKYIIDCEASGTPTTHCLVVAC